MRQQQMSGLQVKAQDRAACEDPQASLFFDQLRIEELKNALAVLNEQIAESESDGNWDYPLDGLRFDAMALARQIDDLRCSLLRLK